MGVVVPIRKCRRCGRLADVYREVEFGGRTVFSFWCCRPCWEETRRYIARDRAVFARLIEMGIDRRVANEMMIAKNRAEREPCRHGTAEACMRCDEEDGR